MDGDNEKDHEALADGTYRFSTPRALEALRQGV